MIVSLCAPIYAEAQVVNIDLRKGLIGPISVFDSPEQIRSKLGPSRVEAFTGESEGESYRGYILKFGNGQTVTANHVYLEIRSAGFKTVDGLGVGSRWRFFSKAFSDGDLRWLPDANAIWSETYKFRLCFKGGREPLPNDAVTSIEIIRRGQDR